MGMFYEKTMFGCKKSSFFFSRNSFHFSIPFVTHKHSFRLIYSRHFFQICVNTFQHKHLTKSIEEIRESRKALISDLLCLAPSTSLKHVQIP